jgi:cyclopropane fatty-acyl-phospholipid synthase-like methyltransferase
VWGQDNIHLGYYPHIATKDLVKLDNVQAADALTKRMIELAKIDHNSTVLDLGCGKGQSARVIAQHTGAAVTGIDLSTTNIERANEVAANLPMLKLKFYEGSFTDLPAEVLSQKYTHIFSQVAFCHVHQLLPSIFAEAQKVMTPSSVMIVNDYLGGKKKPSEMTREHVHKRLHFAHLHTHREWRRIAEEAGFVIEAYEDLDKHMAETYQDMEIKARRLGFKSTDGALLADNYKMTVEATKAGENGMNVALLTLGLPKAPVTSVDMSAVYVTEKAVCAARRIWKGDVVEKGLVRGDKLSGAAMFYATAESPTCEMKKQANSFEIVALKDIAIDEELTMAA